MLAAGTGLRVTGYWLLTTEGKSGQPMCASFRVGISSGVNPAGGGNLIAPEAYAILEEHGIGYELFDVAGPEVQAGEIARYDAIILLGERFGPRALGDGTRLV